MKKTASIVKGLIVNNVLDYVIVLVIGISIYKYIVVAAWMCRAIALVKSMSVDIYKSYEEE